MKENRITPLARSSNEYMLKDSVNHTKNKQNHSSKIQVSSNSKNLLHPNNKEVPGLTKLEERAREAKKKEGIILFGRKEIEVFEIYRREFLEKLRSPLVTRKKKPAAELRQVFLESMSKEAEDGSKVEDSDKAQALKSYQERQDLKKSLKQFDPQVSYRDKLLFPKQHWNEGYKQFQKEFIKRKFIEKQKEEKLLSDVIIEKLKNKEKLSFNCNDLGDINLTLNNLDTLTSEDSYDFSDRTSYLQDKITTIRKMIKTRYDPEDYNYQFLTQSNFMTDESFDGYGLTKEFYSTSIDSTSRFFKQRDSRQSTINQPSPSPYKSAYKSSTRPSLKFSRENPSNSIKIDQNENSLVFQASGEAESSVIGRSLENYQSNPLNFSVELLKPGNKLYSLNLDTASDKDTVNFDENQPKSSVSLNQNFTGSKNGYLKINLEPIIEHGESQPKLIETSSKPPGNERKIPCSPKINTNGRSKEYLETSRLFFRTNKKDTIEMTKSIEDPIAQLKKSINNYKGYTEYNNEKFFKTGVDLILRGKYSTQKGINRVSLRKFDVEKQMAKEEHRNRNLTSEGKKKQLVGRKIKLYELRMLQMTGKKLPKEISEQMHRQHNQLTQQLATLDK